ncbi:MAG TPA: DMT family transporter [Polyangia bacterium]|jgi:drug/metabolite transporter (DMT)-like permease|nr:DMT family transporter [Polyangia bacterium]
MQPRPLQTAALTALAMVAFASNSLLTRLALAGRHIDAASFTLVRLVAGALTLAVLVRLRHAPRTQTPAQRASFAGPLALFAYMAPFSFAYLRIGAALGALVLFGTVQITMIFWGFVRGERSGRVTWLGLALAVAGLAALTLPSASRPDALGMVLMIAAGIAWGVYSLVGKTAAEPLAANARSFLLGVPLALILSAITLHDATATTRGLTLAVTSGAITSALGYAIWYRALRGLTATRAAVVQLSVPVIAASGAIAILDEAPNTRLVLSGAAVLLGVALALIGRAPRASLGAR